MGSSTSPGQAPSFAEVAVQTARNVMQTSIAARAAIVSTLRGQFVSSLNFNLGRIAIRASDYGDVATAIERGYISVVAHADRVGWADYSYAEANFGTPVYAPALNQSDRALLIHESTHAIFHIRRIDAVEEQFEGAAYIAQALYSILDGVTGSGTPPPDPYELMSWAAWKMVWEEAFRLAQVAKEKKTVTDQDAKRLYNALQFTNFYRGLRGRWISFQDIKPVFPIP